MPMATSWWLSVILAVFYLEVTKAHQLSAEEASVERCFGAYVFLTPGHMFSRTASNVLVRKISLWQQAEKDAVMRVVFLLLPLIPALFGFRVLITSDLPFLC
jgi:hypothetical protein